MIEKEKLKSYIIENEGKNSESRLNNTQLAKYIVVKEQFPIEEVENLRRRISTVKDKLINKKVIKDNKKAKKEGKQAWDIKNDKTASFEYVGDEPITTLEQALKFCEADLSKWEVERYVFNSWMVTAFDLGVAIQKTNYQVKLFFKAITKSHSHKEDVIAKILNKINKTPIVNPIPKQTFSKKDCVLELSLPDLHLNKLSDKNETGEAYDSKIAVKRFNEVIDNILNEVDLGRVEKFLLPIGNDLFNIDDNKNNMTHAGTPQDVDTRWWKMFDIAQDLFTNTIDRLLTIAPVDVVMVSGNHDTNNVIHLGNLLKAWYRNSLDVTIDNNPILRKYYQYGQNLIMYTHGNNEKHNNLLGLCATEQPIMWSQTKYRAAHLGHFHKHKEFQTISIDEEMGFKVRILPSLSGTDKWHHSKGYLGIKSGVGLLHHKENGCKNMIIHNVKAF